MINIAEFQKYIPGNIKSFLKPYYRKLFPDRLHIVFWNTFQCNYKCSYCPIVTKFNYGNVITRDMEKSATEWIDAFQKLPPAMIYISGGEPFLYHEMVDLINGLPEKHHILGIVTNLTRHPDFYRKLNKRPHLNVSFHREFISEEKFLSRINELKSDFHICVNIVATPENINVIKLLYEIFKVQKIDLHIDPFIEPGFSYSSEQKEQLEQFISHDRKNDKQAQFDDYELKICSAGKNYINILPNGQVLTCAGGMDYLYSPLVAEILEKHPGKSFNTGRFSMGNIFDPSFTLRTSPMACTLPCKAACDLDAVSIKRD